MKKLKLFSLVMVAIASCLLLSACGSNISLKINFDSNGGTYCKPIEYVVGKSFNMPDDPTKENYIFDGWYEDNETWEKPFTVNTVLNYPLSKDVEITVYAKWNDYEHFVFNYNNDLGTEKVYLSDFDNTLPTPTSDTHTFLGWYTDNGTFENRFNVEEEFVFDRNNQINLYAKWEAKERIILHKNNGEENEIYYINGDIELPTPKKGLSFFCGWSTDKDSEYIMSSVHFNPNNFNLDEDNKIDVYAVWADVDGCSVVAETFKNTYYWGEEPDFSNAKLEIYYKKAMGHTIIPLTSDMIQNLNTKQYIPNISFTNFNEYVVDNEYTAQIIVDNVEYDFNYYIVPEFETCKIIDTTLKKEFTFDEKYNICDNTVTLEIEYKTGEKKTVISRIGSMIIENGSTTYPYPFQMDEYLKPYVIESYLINFSTQQDGELCVELYYHNYKLNYIYNVENREIKSAQIVEKFGHNDYNATLENCTLHIEYTNNTNEDILITKDNILIDVNTQSVGDFKAKIVNREREIECEYSVEEYDELFTYGLIFELKDNNKYSVVGYKGTEQNVIVPSIYKGKEVDYLKEISSSIITSLTLPDTILTAHNGALQDCENLTSISFNENMRIENYTMVNEKHSGTYQDYSGTYIVGFAYFCEYYCNMTSEAFCTDESVQKYDCSLITTMLLFKSELSFNAPTNYILTVKIIGFYTYTSYYPMEVKTFKHTYTYYFYSTIPTEITINNTLYTIELQS